MPSKSKKQAKLMRAVAHGWKPSRFKGPTRQVAEEFMKADKRKKKSKKRYAQGGLAQIKDVYDLGRRDNLGAFAPRKPPANRAGGPRMARRGALSRIF